MYLNIDTLQSRTNCDCFKNFSKRRKRKRVLPLTLLTTLALLPTAKAKLINQRLTVPSSTSLTKDVSISPFYVWDGQDWVEDSGWTLMGRSGSDAHPSVPVSSNPFDQDSNSGNLPVDPPGSGSNLDAISTLPTPTSAPTPTPTSTPTSSSTDSPSSSPSSSASSTLSSLTTPLGWDVRDQRTSYYAVPLIIISSIVVATAIITFIALLFAWKRKRRIQKKWAEKQDKELSGESSSTKFDHDHEHGKKLGKGIFKLKSTFKRRLRPRIFKSSSSPTVPRVSTMEVTHCTSCSPHPAMTAEDDTVRRRRKSAVQNEDEDHVVSPSLESAATHIPLPPSPDSTALPLASTSTAPLELESEPQDLIQDDTDVPIGPPAYRPSSMLTPLSARALEKRREISPPEDNHSEELPPSLPEISEEELTLMSLNRERLLNSLSGHVAIDEKSRLEALELLSSQPPRIDSPPPFPEAPPMESHSDSEDSEDDSYAESEDEERFNPLPPPPKPLLQSSVLVSRPLPSSAPSAPPLPLSTTSQIPSAPAFDFNPEEDGLMSFSIPHRRRSFTEV